MDIREVKTCIKVADIVKNTGSSQADVIFNYCIDSALQQKQCGIVYLFVVNGEIHKIGYTRSKGGIKSAMGAYQGGLGGSPSLRTYGIHILLSREVEKGNQVEVYGIFSEPIKGNVKGLFGTHEKNLYPSHEMEELCKNDYKVRDGNMPQWNYKENGQEFPNDIQQAHAAQITKQKAKRK